MDEPFSALDPMTRSDLQDELVQLQAKLKKTIVFVTHDMDEAVKIADMICIMKDGDILQYDTPEHILNNPVDEFVSNFVGKNRIWSSPEKMRRNKVDSLLVVERDSRRLMGIVKASRLRGIEDRNQIAEQFMYEDFPFLFPEQCILDALKIVTEKQVSTVPVVDDQRRLKGLITRSSLVTTLSQQYFDYEGGEAE